MAYVPTQDPNDPNNPNNANGQSSTTGGNATLGGESAPLGGGSATGPGSGGVNSPKGTSSGSFTNLQSYIGANEGNDAALGGAVAGDAAGKAASADQAGSGFQTGADAAVDSNTVKDNGVIGQLGGMDNGTSSAPIDQGQFSKQYNAQYNGPANAAAASGYSDAQGAYQNVQDYANTATNGGLQGRETALNDVYGKNGQQYNQGEQQLDGFILGNGAGGQAALNSIGQKYGNYTDNFGKIASGVDHYAQQGADTTKATKADTQAAATKAWGDVGGRVDQAAGTASTDNANANALYGKLQSGDAGAWQGQGMNAAGNTFLGSHGANWSNYVSGPKAYDAGDFASAPDAANYTQLSGLINGAGGSAAAKYTPAQLQAAHGSGPVVNQADVAGANQAAGIYNTGIGVQGRMNAQSAPQLADAQTMAANHSTDLAAQLGVSTADLQRAYADGLDPAKYLSANSNATLGDALSSGDRGTLTNLSSMLGISPIDVSTNDYSNNGYHFDNGGFGTALAAAQPRAATLPVNESSLVQQYANTGIDQPKDLSGGPPKYVTNPVGGGASPTYSQDKNGNVQSPLQAVVGGAQHTNDMVANALPGQVGSGYSAITDPSATAADVTAAAQNATPTNTFSQLANYIGADSTWP